jgi:hypothetical protein
MTNDDALRAEAEALFNRILDAPYIYKKRIDLVEAAFRAQRAAEVKAIKDYMVKRELKLLLMPLNKHAKAYNKGLEEIKDWLACEEIKQALARYTKGGR